MRERHLQHVGDMGDTTDTHIHLPVFPLAHRVLLHTQCVRQFRLVPTPFRALGPDALTYNSKQAGAVD